MIRVLVLIAVAGFVVSVVTLATAVGLAGPEAVAHGAWTFGPDGWGARWTRHHDHGRNDAEPQTSRDLPWTGGDALTIDLPANVTYAQAPGPAKITLSGSQNAVDEVKIEDGRIVSEGDDDDDDDRLTIKITAPSVTHFKMSGSGKLGITDYSQDALALELPGSADVTVSGQSKSVALTISGSANANLEALKARTAKVDIDGSGDAKLAPTDSAEVHISGSGDVTLLTHPPRLQTSLTGSGRVVQDAGAGT